MKSQTSANIRFILLFLIGVSLNFESISLVGSFRNFTISFILSTLYLLSCAPLLSSFQRVIAKYKRNIIPVAFFLCFLCIVNAFNANIVNSQIFPLSLIACFILYIALLMNLEKDARSIYAIMCGFAFGTIILSTLFILGIGVEIDQNIRLSMFGANANNLGLMMCIASAIIMYKFILLDCLKLKVLRFIFILPLIMICTLIFATASRSAFIGLTLIIILIIVTMPTKHKLGKAIFIIGGIIAIIYSLQLPSYFDILYNRLISLGDTTTSESRADMWKILLPYAFEHPIFGVGETGYSVISMDVFYTNEISGAGSPHNGLLEVFLYTGLVGFIPMIAFWSRLGIYSVKYYMKTKDILLVLLYVPVVVQIMFGQILPFKIIWIVYAIIIFSYYNHNIFRGMTKKLFMEEI
jgi:O-antigen ligase